MDTITAVISAALQPGPGEIIYCNPPRGVALGLGSHGLARMWKLQAPLEVTCLADMGRTQSSSIPIMSFGFIPIGSGGAFWMYFHPPDKMLLCALDIAMQFYVHSSRHDDSEFFVADTFVGMHIIWDSDASKMYLSQTTLIDRLLEQEFVGIMVHEYLTSNDLRYNPGQELHKWDQLCPCSILFDYKMPKLLLLASPPIAGSLDASCCGHIDVHSQFPSRSDPCCSSGCSFCS